MAEIIAFPQERNVGKARHVAKLYLGKQHEKARYSYWGLIISNLEKQLARSGFDEQSIAAEILAFRNAVQNEIYQLENSSNKPGGAV